MESKNLKQTALLIQVAGLGILLLGTKGFLIFGGTPLYFPSLIIAIIVFAVCFFKGGAMHKKAKEMEKSQGN